MEKAFKLGKNSKLYKDYQKYINDCDYQRKCVKEFFENNGIETHRYYVAGDGSVGVPFSKHKKKEIRLGLVEATDNDREKFKSMLLKEDANSISLLRINSKLNKEFQDFAVEKQMIINLWQPDMRDYFKSMEWKGYTLSIIQDKDYNWYIKISSELLKDDDIPEGIEEINMSEFYSIKESKVDNND